MTAHRTSSAALLDLLGISAPVVLGPFGGVSSVQLAAAVSDGGGLGSFGLYGYAPEAITRTAAELRAATGQPFALNLWVPTGTEVSHLPTAEYEAYAQRTKPFFDALGLPLPEMPNHYLPDFNEQVDATLAASPAVVSFVFGVPGPEVVDAAHRRGIKVIGTATTVAEAVALESGGVDAVVASGMESGGHRVSFLAPAEESLVGTFALVPQVADAIGIPVIAAGGIADRRGVAAALALGAAGVQVGTAFLATQESAAAPAYRDVLRSPAAAQTVLTRAMSGRLARGIPNRVTAELADPSLNAPFPIQNWLTGHFRARATAAGRTDLMSLWAGQSAPLLRHDTAHDVLTELIAGLS
ncbi:Nitronate monooxygenase [Arthrobacter ulcerisalmonis]|uniref:Propionate 3-nitronate monooxygenase n=1 Tax=Arthrobacter ulcerisalmonis TaxID=2483813 RepID=A0A3P5WSP1_9MICC|nr:nitronate monooxygenase [Arthrobacter ulcerisalmonis]VDC22210.1 Nitronate monooxygenase [Arthrobacter ulcerisalmonis]